MQLNKFPKGSYVKLRRGGGWWEIVRFQNKGKVCFLKSSKDSKEKETFRGSDTHVTDWLVGRNSSQSTLTQTPDTI